MNAFAVLTATAAVGSSLVGGVFFAFSGFVMPALQRLPTASGLAAMQSINVAAVGPPLMTALFGTAATAVAVPIVAWGAGRGRSTLVLVCLAGGCYLLGTVGTTVAANVPLNDRLAAATALPADAWTQWVTAWTHGNHLRTAAALAAAALYTAALLRPAS